MGMSKSRRQTEEERRIKKVGKTVKSKFDKYRGLINNIESVDDLTDELYDEFADELYYEEHKHKYN